MKIRIFHSVYNVLQHKIYTEYLEQSQWCIHQQTFGVMRAILNKSWWQHPTKNQLYGHLPPITKTIKLDKPDTQDTAGEAEMNS